MVNLSYGGYRALAAPAAGALLDADGRRYPGDEVHVGAGELLDELPRVHIHRIQKPALPFGKEEIEGQRAFA